MRIRLEFACSPGESHALAMALSAVPMFHVALGGTSSRPDKRRGPQVVVVVEWRRCR